MGPTASGKSALALRLAQAFNGEIINVDSALLYRGMDIGTAKPSLIEQGLVAQHLLDHLEPTAVYSAADFCNDALAAMAAIQARGKVPFLVGGTMLYFKALLAGLSILPQAHPELRRQMTQQADQYSWGYLHAELQSIDPIAAARIHANDAQRIQRALELFRLTGRTPTELYAQQTKAKCPYEALQIALIPHDRAILHQRIAARFACMLEQGLVDEVKTLYVRDDIQADSPAMRSVGYRQVWQYLAGETDYVQMQEKAIAATRQLAKRQLTWLRSWPNLTCFDIDYEFAEVRRVVTTFLTAYAK